MKAVKIDRLIDAPRPLLPDILALHEKWRAGKPALICEGRTLTWRELGEETNRVANALRALDLKTGASIAIIMDNSVEMVEVLIGAMKAGCVSVPLNLTVSDSALAAMIGDADARAVIVSPSQRERVNAVLTAVPQANSLHMIVVGRGDEKWMDYNGWKASQPAIRPDVEIRPDDILNIIYSSGTTGRPKGIPHTHQTRLDMAYDLSIALRYHGAVRTLCTLGLYSNISWVTLLCTFLPGGALVVSRNFDAGRFLRDVEKHRITHTVLVPVQLRRILDHPDMTKDAVASMQAMMSCGSPLHADVKRRVFDMFECGVIELYGLTEGVLTTLDPEDAAGRLASVGTPILGSDIKIIDDDGRDTPAGVPGEIASRARIVMPGYHNNPEATREAIWRDADGRVWLRTGDIGRLDEDGYLYIVDRKKDMILSGGQNIFPTDIESVLLEHPQVADAAVIGVPHPEWDETPFAVIEARDSNASIPEIIEWVNQRVGRRQRVSGGAIVDELPRNPNGKILKRQLRERFSKKAA